VRTVVGNTLMKRSRYPTRGLEVLPGPHGWNLEITLLLPRRERERERNKQSLGASGCISDDGFQKRCVGWVQCWECSFTWERWGSVEFHRGEIGGMWSKGIDILEVGLLRGSH
jgi:hypothetical protein